MVKENEKKHAMVRYNYIVSFIVESSMQFLLKFDLIMHLHKFDSLKDDRIDYDLIKLI